MKKMSLPLVAVAVLAAGAPVSVLAAEKTYDTDGVVQFIPGTEPTQPVDPTKPDPDNPVKPVDPVDPTGPKPGTDGPLSIDYASSFDFGLNKISNKSEVYYARAQTYKNDEGAIDKTKSTPNYVQVSDNRGSNAGWTLSVKQNGQFNNADTVNKVLTGSVIKLVSPTLKTQESSTAIAPVSPISTASGLVLDSAGASSVVASAGVGTGAGTWAAAWGEKSDVKTVTEKNAAGEDVDAQITETVSLSVPGSTPKDAVKYSTTLTWVLSDTPSA
ncbi:hypothetical protein IGI37_003820 [Enterococcus sp. AZ194]|uniref:WxL domain-containing protein n=1 Tax=Enterococcus sp. AZ194 TaxID=2774629 RepID=UPI003F29A74C